MNIAVVVTQFPCLSETFVLNHICGLKERGHEVTIISRLRPVGEKRHPDVDHYDLLTHTRYWGEQVPASRFKRALAGMGLALKISKGWLPRWMGGLGLIAPGTSELLFMAQALQGHFDIVHCHFGSNGIMAARLKAAGLLCGKLLVNFHGQDVNSQPFEQGNNIYEAMFRRADALIVNSHFTRDRVIALGGPAERIVVVRESLRVERFPFVWRKQEPGSPLIILTVGRLVEKKGHAIALEALARFRKKFPQEQILYWVAGDGPLREILERQCLDLGLNEIVRFWGAVDESQAIPLFQQAHIFLCPSVTAANQDREGQALVVQEAQACGLPVIATRHNGIPEGMEHGITGFLVPERDPEAIVERLAHLVAHPELWPAMGAAGRDFVAQRFDTRLVMPHLEGLYERLVATS